MRISTLIPLFIIITFVLQFNTTQACTSFCMDTDKGPIFGCNLDLLIPGDGFVFINQRSIAKKGFWTGTTGITAEWISKYGSVTFNLAGREFAYGGMNEAGLVVGGMELLDSEYPELDERPPLSIGTWVQYVLDNYSTVQEVIQVNDLVRIEDQIPPSHFLIADAQGNCVAIEWHEGRFVHYTGETLPVKAMSNSIYSQALKIYIGGGPSWWESDRGETNKRFAQAAERNDGFKTSGESNAIKYAFETLTQIVAAPHTKWNIVYNIAERQVFFRSAASPTLKYLSLKEFDFSCSAPLLMLDINSAIEGDISKAFKPYDHDINLTVFKTLCARYKIQISEEDTNEIMKHIESFKCTQ